ncbi:DNA recombinase [Yersinia similis]|uniref:DNA recombinase n=1 Tax=Yersinia similis TaxID=367190 RepID=A0ABM5Q529_9GAMM|nr:hypothetical protein [Yersinia similis]AHK21845.1 DNA recombinase [Yersinia similis]
MQNGDDPQRGFPSQTKTFNTKAEADAWAKIVESEMARGVWLSRSESESTTLYDSLVRYENEIVANKRERCKIGLLSASLSGNH